MSSAEKLYLLLVVCALVAFAASLAYQTWQWARMDASRRAAEVQPKPSKEAERLAA